MHCRTLDRAQLPGMLLRKLYHAARDPSQRPFFAKTAFGLGTIFGAAVASGADEGSKANRANAKATAGTQHPSTLTDVQKAWRTQHPVIRYGVAGADWPPFEFNRSVPAEGISDDFLHELAR